MSNRVTVSTAQIKLAVVWLFGAGVIFLLMLAQTVGGKYGNQSQRAWAWFLPTVVPTLSLILGAIVYAARDPKTEGQTVDKSVYRIAYGLSAFYLAAVLSTLLLQPLSGMQPLEFITGANVWLSAVQGIVGVALGAFFTSKH